MLTIRNKFTLDIIGSALKGFQHPGGEYEPAGEWENSYAICTLAGNCWQIGRLTVSKKQGRGGNFVLGIDDSRNVPEGNRFHTVGEVVCGNDKIATPAKWRYEVNLFDSAGQGIENMRIEKVGKAERGRVEIMQGGRKKSLRLSGDFTFGWNIFEAAGRLARGDFEPISFTMLDHYDQVKEGQEIRYGGAAEVETGGGVVKVHAFEQTGRGIVPWVYWVDEKGRVLFVVSGLEAYIYHPAGKADIQF